MKVLTIKQPFASLIASGLKEYEFRTWKTKYRGEVLIHAGLSVDKKAMERFKNLNLEYPLGCIIAKVNLTDCLEITPEVRNELIKKDSLIYNNLIVKPTWQGYGFKLENVVKIEPIYTKGKLSFWNYEGDINESKSRN